MQSVLQWIDQTLKGPDATLFVEALGVLLAIVLAKFFPKLGTGVFRLAEILWKQFAEPQRRAMVLAFLTPIVIRLLMWPVYPTPQPKIHDEFSHLLIADTLLHGRLSNPTHPMWEHLETIHVIFHPTYASKYPVGQGVALAIPQIVGLPSYCGMWLSCG